MRESRKWIVVLGLFAFLMLYVGGYLACRTTRILVHTDGVYNLDERGRSHMISVAHGDSALADMAGYLFWPLRELEAIFHDRD